LIASKLDEEETEKEKKRRKKSELIVVERGRRFAKSFSFSSRYSTTLDWQPKS